MCCMRNLNPSLGLCNGTILIYKSFGHHLIVAEIITCVHCHEIVLILIISFIPSETQLPLNLNVDNFQLVMNLQ